MKIFALFAVFLLFAVSVSAIGIGPPEYVVDFKLNFSQNFTILVLNNAGKDITAKIFAEGDLAQYVTLPENTTLFIREGGRASFNYGLNLPERIERPGIHDTKIGVVEETPEQAGISAVTAATSRLRVLVPYPGKYLEASFSAENAEIGKLVNFRLTATSRSTEIINKISIAIDIYYGEEKLTSVEMPEIKNLKPSETAERTVKWDTKGYKVGSYKAVARIIYDENEIKKEDVFTIGTVYIAILNHTKEFEIGKINRFDIQIQSQWNYDITDTYGDILIMKNETRIANLKTPSFSIAPWAKKTISAYWDIKEDIMPGDYNSKIILNYLNKTTVKESKLTVKQRASLNTTLIIISALILALLFTFLNIFFLHKEKKARKRGK